MDDLDMTIAAIQASAARVRKATAWVWFGVAFAVIVLVIDVQLKTSLARQAMAASKILAQAVGLDGTGPEADPGGGRGDPGDDGGRGVDADPGVAAADDRPAMPKRGQGAGRPVGRPVRPPGDG